MDKNAIKKYAVWARTELIARVTQKALQYGIEKEKIVDAAADSVHGKVLSAAEKKQRQALIAQIQAKGFEHVMEEVAYTWFNRFSALRFMEVNGYLPSHVRVFTDEENNFKPQILTEAIHLELDGLDMEKVYAYKEADKTEELFKYLLIVQCNALNDILPGMFQKIEDYTELLLPDNLLREGSVVEQLVTTIPEADWKDAVQIIGWLYQFYNTEPKDKVFANLKKNIKITKENIPAATQLFTPDWIVRYMVENSLGRLWQEGHPDSELRSEWKYYLDEPTQSPNVQNVLDELRQREKNISPEDIRCIDPCMGSGHILAYMFDVLMQIYLSYGYTSREATTAIVEKNLWGLDIDERAAQLAYFAIMMKARQYDRRFFSRNVQPHVYSICESNGLDSACIDYFTGDNSELKSSLENLIENLRDAKEYGSIVDVPEVNFDLLLARFEEVKSDISIFAYPTMTELYPFVLCAQALSQKYDVVVTNPPYMSINGMAAKQGDYLKKHYPNSKSDMSTVFMEKTLSMCKNGRYMAMINIPVWMFISSYEHLRKILIENHTLINMVHPGRGIFGSDFGTTSFVFRKGLIDGYTGHYRRLYDAQGEVETVDVREEQFLAGKGKYFSAQNRYVHIPGWPFAYWLTENYIKSFERKSVGDQFIPKFGMSTGDGERFIRFWYETEFGLIDFANKCEKDADQSVGHWVPIDKGGAFRRWYGNQNCVVWWKNNGSDIRQHPKSAVRSPQYFFTPHVSWTLMTMGTFSARFFDSGFAIDTASNCVYFNGDISYELIGFMNSKVAADILSILNPTINFSCGVISLLPFGELKSQLIEEKVKECIDLSKQDWDDFETSWGFRKHPLVPTAKEWDEQRQSQFAETRVQKFSVLAWHYEQWKIECDFRFDALKSNEEELNRIFIENYGLCDELSCEIDENEITVRRADLQREIKSLISYAVGCMFGRYSLDAPGLVYAGGEWDASKYATFPADKDSIIPICDDEYFEDDIVGRFIKFVEVVYGKDTLNENLKFIADALGGKGNPKDVIRSYFLNDFYNDHVKMYQKRPIYWLFDSGKKNGFKCLVYMHRYQPDTIARIRTDYVHEQQARYRTAIADLEQRISNASAGERVKLSKKLKTLQEQASEIHGYEEKIHHLADQMIRIDLDDGVKKNYEIFKDVLAKIK